METPIIFRVTQDEVTTPQEIDDALPLDPNKYRARILEVDISEHPDGYEMVMIKMQVFGAPTLEHYETKWYHIKSKKAHDFFIKDLAKIGVKIQTREDFEQQAKVLPGQEVEINVQYQNGNKAIYFVKRLSGIEQPPSSVSFWR